MSNDKPTIIGPTTLVQASLVITLVSAALSFGIMWQRVDDLDARLARIETKVDTIIQKQTTASVAAK